MTTSANELMSRGMECFPKTLGTVEAEKFVSLLLQERFDYTKWQREYFDGMAPGEFQTSAVAHAKAHPFTGSAERL